MKGLKTLVFMQLKDKIDFSYLKSVKQTIFKVVLSILKFAIITALIYAAFFVLSFLRLVSVLPGVPQNFFAVLFTIMYLLSIVVCTFGLMKSLYFSNDNALLLTLPASRTTVFTSKLVVYYLYELIRNVNYILPLFLAYGLINGLPIYYYFWLIVAFFILTAIPVILGALLSIPAMVLTTFVKQNKWIEYILLVLVIGGVVTGLVFLISAIPENFNLIGSWGTTFWKIQDFMEVFNRIFIPFGWIVTAVIGERYGVSNMMFTSEQFINLASILGILVAVVAITYLLVRPLFFKMASTPFEYRKKKVTKTFKNKQVSTFWSGIKKDIFLNYRTPEKFYGLLVVVLGMPLAIFLLNKIYAAINIRLSGAYMVAAFNILMILLIALSSNSSMAHVYSEEGASAYLSKTTPKTYLKILFSKLIVNLVTVSLSLLVTVFIFTSFVGYSIWTGIIIYLALESVYVGHLLWSAEMDMMNPQNEQYRTVGSHINNPNEIKSVLWSLLLSAALAFFTYFLIPEGATLVWYKILLVSVLFLGARIWLYVNKVKVYYKEK